MKDPSELPCYETVDSLKVKAGCIQLPKAQRLTEGNFTITSFVISPDGKHIAFGHQPDPLINSFLKSDISIVIIADKKLHHSLLMPAAMHWKVGRPIQNKFCLPLTEQIQLQTFIPTLVCFQLITTRAVKQLAKNLDEDLGGFT